MGNQRKKGYSPLLKCAKTVKKNNMLQKGDKVVVALSGGPDSVFLLYLLNNHLKKEYELTLHIAHLNHAIRGEESDKDEEFALVTAEKLGIEITSEKIDAFAEKEKYGTSLESACHFARISFLRKTKEKTGADIIATGHTLDDRIESLFMNMLRGTALSGLKGISPVNETYAIVRPLIETSKAEIIEYLTSNAIPFVFDSTNFSEQYERNLIRKKLLPVIEEFKPAYRNALNRTMDNISVDDDYMQILCRENIPKAFRKDDSGAFRINRIFFKTAHHALGRRVMTTIFEDFKTPRTRITTRHIDESLRFIKESCHGQKLHLPSHIRIINSYGEVLIKSVEDEVPIAEKEASLYPGEKIESQESGFAMDCEILDAEEIDSPKTGRNEAFLDFDKLSFPLLIRKRREGDFFYPLGAKGKKKIKDFFIGLKIPQRERKRIPLVFSGNDIVWVAGYRISDKFKVTKGTKKILRLVIKKLNSR